MWQRKPTYLGWLAAVLLINPLLSAAAPPLVGQAFPIGDSITRSGKPLASTEGKVILYDFWASWCTPCKASFPAMQRLMKDYGDRGFIVIAINEDEKSKKMDRFLKRQKVSFPIVHDKGHALIEQLKVKTMPSAFLVDRQGIIRSVHQGFHEDKSEEDYREAIEALLAER